MRILLSGLLLSLTTYAWAGNAGWYRWEGSGSAQFVCAQSSPGKGWKKIAGPYRDATCTHPR